MPVLSSRRSGGECALIGGYVVRDPSLPSLYGRYVFGDYCNPSLRSAKLRRGGASAPAPSPRKLGAGGATGGVLATMEAGLAAVRDLACTHAAGSVYRLASR